MAARLTCAAKSDVGLKRTNNEDNYGMVPSQGLYVLADGMGGHASGQVASTMCVSHVAQFICETCRKPGFEFPYPPDSKLSYEANLLVNAIKYANERIFIQSCKERSMEGMGTTVTAIMNSPRGLILAHVGDSRIYRVRKGQIVQMTRDHSLLNHLLDTGELKPEDAKNFANKNVILRAIGLKDYVDVEVKEVPREAGDTYMMCSDGLSDIVSEALICQAITSHPDLPEACNELISLALKAGGKDNVTVVCVHVEPEDGAVSQASPAVSRSVPPVPGSAAAKGAQGGVSPAAMGAQGGVSPGGLGGRMPSEAMMQQQMMQQQMMMQQMMMQQQMMGRGGYPVGMGGVPGQMPMGMPMGHAGMAPMPMGRPNIQQPSVSAPQPSSAPQRMHSVREIVIVEAPPAQRSMPKFIGGSRQGGGMAPVPGKPRPAVKEEAGGSHAAAEVQEAAKSGEGLRKVNELSTEDRSLLPETELLLSAPPSAAPSESEDLSDADSHIRTMTDCAVVDDETLEALGACQAVAEAETAVPGIQELSDESEEADDDETRISPMPAFASGALAPSSFPLSSPSSPGVSSETVVSPAPMPVQQPSSPGLPSQSAPSFEPPSFSYTKVADPDPLPPKGYVAPKEAIRPPAYDFDDDDSIEISGGYEMGDDDDDDDDVTRQYIRPPVNRW